MRPRPRAENDDLWAGVIIGAFFGIAVTLIGLGSIGAIW